MKKSPPAPRPAFTCRAVRWWRAVIDENAGARHVARCEACQRHFAACDDFELALRREATRAPAEARPGLEQRIVHAVRAAQRPAATTATAPFSFARIATAGTALAVIVAASVLFRPAPTAGTGDEIAALVDTAESLSDQWWGSVLPSAATALQDNALQKEMNSVVVGARSALDFLALNFLPTTTTPTAAPSPSGRI